MANKIKLTRGTKANIEANKSSLETYQIVYATDTSEIGVKKANGNVDYFPDIASVTTAVSNHNSSALAHSDIRNALNSKLEEETDPTVPAWAKTEPPSAVRFMRMNTNNTITWRTAAQLRGDIGAATPANITTAVSDHNVNSSAHTDLFNTKLDKITSPTIDPTVERVYGTDNAGNQKEFNVARFAYDDTIVMRDEIGRILDLETHNSSELAHPDIRNSLNTKLDKKVLLGTGEYIDVDIVRTGEIQGQTGMPAIHISESNQNITLGSYGISSVSIANEPIANDHAATKKYADDTVTTNISNHNTDSNAHTDIREYVDSKTMKLINSGSSTALSKTGYTTLILPADSYAGKTVAVEIKYGSSSSTLYTNKVIYVTLGTSTSTTVSKTVPKFITLSDWDGEYLKHISVKTYVDAGTTSSIYFGYVKTLIGRFTGSTIDWTTQANDNINVYIGKVWLVG